MDKRFAIFDMDGTLVDSMVYWKHLATEFLESKGVQTIATDILERIKPMTMTESAALFIEEYGFRDTAESIAARIFRSSKACLLIWKRCTKKALSCAWPLPQRKN